MRSGQRIRCFPPLTRLDAGTRAPRAGQPATPPLRVCASGPAGPQDLDHRRPEQSTPKRTEARYELQGRGLTARRGSRASSISTPGERERQRPSARGDPCIPRPRRQRPLWRTHQPGTESRALVSDRFSDRLRELPTVPHCFSAAAHSIACPRRRPEHVERYSLQDPSRQGAHSQQSRSR